MRGLKIIPVFVVLILCTYVGILFVEANRDPVTITFGRYQSPPTALGLVVLTAVLIGMVIAGALCSIELMALAMQNRKLRRRAPARVTPVHPSAYDTAAPPPVDEPTESGQTEPRANDHGSGRNRFTPL